MGRVGAARARVVRVEERHLDVGVDATGGEEALFGADQRVLSCRRYAVSRRGQHVAERDDILR